MTENEDQEEVAYRGCLGFMIFAWLAPIILILFFGWAIYGGGLR